MLKNICKYMLILSLLAWLLPPEMAKAAGTLPKGGTIAGIAVGGLSYEKAYEKVQLEVGSWLTEAPIQAEGTDEAISIPRDTFLFDIDRTFDELEQQTKRPWYLFFLKSKPIQIPLHVQISENHQIEWPDYTDADATLQKAKEAAATLGDQPVTIIYKEESELPKGKVAETTFQIPDISHVEIEQMADKIDGQTVEPDSQFSFISSVLEEVRPTVSQEGASFFATALYAAILKTNMDIIERHSQRSIPSYSEAGIEAAADLTAKKDFIIYNPNFHSYTFSAEVKENKLHISVSSVMKDTSYGYQVENKSEVKPRTLYRFSYKLAPGSRVPMESGMKGIQVEVYRISSVNGSVKEKTLISRDFYPPTPTVFLVSSQEPPEVIEELLEENEESSDETNNGGEDAEQNAGTQSGTQTNLEESQNMVDLLNKTCRHLEDESEQKLCEKVFLNSALVKGGKMTDSRQADGKTTDTSEDKQ